MTQKTKTTKAKKTATKTATTEPTPVYKNGVAWEYRFNHQGVIRITKEGVSERYWATIVAHKVFKSRGETIAVLRLEKMEAGGNVYHTVVGQKGHSCSCKSRVECKHIKAITALLEKGKL